MALKAEGRLAERYLNRAARALYLIRPDQHVAARWVSASPEAIAQAQHRALGAAHG